MSACSMLPKNVFITGYARSKLSDEDLKEKVKSNIKGDAQQIQDFLKLFSYVAGAYDEAGGFQQLHKKLQDTESKFSSDPAGRLFYLALPPSVYPQVYLSLRNMYYGVSQKKLTQSPTSLRSSGTYRLHVKYSVCLSACTEPPKEPRKSLAPYLQLL